MTKKTRPPRSPEATATWRRMNNVQTIVVPVIAGIILLFAFSPRQLNQGSAVLAALSAVPVVLGFCLTLVWRSRLPPVGFFFAGVGFSVLFAIAILALLFGLCVASYKTG